MTHEDLAWLMRCRGDEIVLTTVALNRVSEALASVPNPGEGIKYHTVHDEQGRANKVPATIGTLKITLREPLEHDVWGDWISILEKGERRASVYFPYPSMMVPRPNLLNCLL